MLLTIEDEVFDLKINAGNVLKTSHFSIVAITVLAQLVIKSDNPSSFAPAEIERSIF
jgi:hypothetical protein